MPARCARKGAGTDETVQAESGSRCQGRGGERTRGPEEPEEGAETAGPDRIAAHWPEAKRHEGPAPRDLVHAMAGSRALQRRLRGHRSRLERNVGGEERRRPAPLPP